MFAHRLQLSKNNTLVGAARYHLYLIALIRLIEKSNSRDGRTVIVERLKKIVSLIDAENVNQSIARRARQQSGGVHRVSREPRIFKTQHFGVVRLYQTQFLQRRNVVNSDVAGSITRENNIFPSLSSRARIYLLNYFV